MAPASGRAKGPTMLGGRSAGAQGPPTEHLLLAERRACPGRGLTAAAASLLSAAEPAAPRPGPGRSLWDQVSKSISKQARKQANTQESSRNAKADAK